MNFLRRTPWVGCTERQKLTTKVAQFLGTSTKLRKVELCPLFFKKKEQKK